VWVQLRGKRLSVMRLSSRVEKGDAQHG
jgi:hypothetical protein